MADSAEEIPLEVDIHTVKSLLDRQEEFLLVDCREQDEWDTVHLPQAQLIPLRELPQRVSELEGHRNGLIIVHCHHGGRSLRATNWLRSQGFPQVQSMAGGIDQWAEQIDPSLPRYE